MRQPTNLSKYVAAAVITIVIFLLGLFVGLTVEGKRINLMQDLYTEQQIEVTSSQLQYNYVDQLKTAESCPAMYQVFYTNLKKMDETRDKLDNYAQASKMNSGSFDLLKREYSLENIKYWMLAEQAQKICSQDVVRILYFYGTQEQCPQCANQEFVLNYLKSLFKEKVLIFALDTNLDEPMIDVLKREFNVTAYPGIVIEHQKSSNGFVDKDTLLSEVCGLYNETPAGCAQ